MPTAPPRQHLWHCRLSPIFLHLLLRPQGEHRPRPLLTNPNFYPCGYWCLNHLALDKPLKNRLLKRVVFYSSITSTCIIKGSTGHSLPSVSTVAILSNTSSPSYTSPKTVCW